MGRSSREKEGWPYFGNKPRTAVEMHSRSVLSFMLNLPAGALLGARLAHLIDPEHGPGTGFYFAFVIIGLFGGYIRAAMVHARLADDLYS